MAFGFFGGRDMKQTRLCTSLLSAGSMICASFFPVAVHGPYGAEAEAAAALADDPAAVASAAKSACDQGVAAACHNMGFYYENGQGVPQDYAQAAAYYKRGCDGGETDSCVGLGNLYLDGKGVGQNPAEADALYRRACGNGDAKGCEALSVMYAQGLGRAAKNYTQAALAAERACELGNMEGCRSIGVFYAIGEGVEQDFQHAIALFERGCQGGDQVSCGLVEKAKADAAALASSGGASSEAPPASPPPASSSASADGDVFSQCVRLEDLGQSGIQHMWQLRNVCNATIKVAYCFRETFAAAGDTNMCADREYDHRTIASGATFDFPFSPLPDGTALSDGRVVKGNEFRVAGFACANGSAPDVYFNNGQFILNHC